MTARPGLQWSDGAAGPVLAAAGRRDISGRALAREQRGWNTPKPFDRQDALSRMRKGYKLSGICAAYGISERRTGELLAIAREAGLEYRERAHGPRRDRTPRAQRTTARLPVPAKAAAGLVPARPGRRPACEGSDPEIFFSEDTGAIDAAKAICAGCPVRGACLAYALAQDEKWGVWGGLSPDERASLANRNAAAA